LILTLRLIARDSVLRTASVALFFSGVMFSSTVPYQSLVAIGSLRISDAAFSVTVAMASLVGVMSSVFFGIRSDKSPNRLRLIQQMSLAGTLGFGVIWFSASAVSFWFCTILLIPIAGSMYGQFFAIVRLYCMQHYRNQAAAITATIRALFALSWITAPPLIAIGISAGMPLISAYLLAAVSAGVIFLLLGVSHKILSLPAPTALAKSKSFLSSLRELATARIISRVLAVGTILGAHRLNAIVIALIITTKAHGTESDVGYVAALTALLEIPLMIITGRALQFVRQSTLLSIAAAFFSVYLMLLFTATSTPIIYALCFVNAAAAAIILSVNIVYIQELVADSPGLGSSLMSITSFVSSGIGAATFALGTRVADYSTTALIGAGVAALGGGTLLFLERKRNGLSS
jgi:predicted MFS family arabinose efflux permease